jgi:hypothetical protein
MRRRRCLPGRRLVADGEHRFDGHRIEREAVVRRFNGTCKRVNIGVRFFALFSFSPVFRTKVFGWKPESPNDHKKSPKPIFFSDKISRKWPKFAQSGHTDFRRKCQHFHASIDRDVVNFCGNSMENVFY